ncbi:MAG TPA: ABC transporter permease [Nitrososphaera sp.]|nr:ABC transporter permease [Nitrososphaera sp.]
MLKENDNDNSTAISTARLTAEKRSSLRDDNGKRYRFDITDVANVALFLAVFVGLWQLVTLLELWPKTLLPPPAQVAISISELITSNSLVLGIATTLWRLVAGFALSIAVGGVVGLTMVKFQGFGKTMSSFAVGLLTFPSIAWIPFSILLIGFNDFGILFVVVMASMFSVMISTYGAIRNVPPIYIRASKNMGAHGFALFRHVMIPAATPSLIGGIRQAWSFAWHALIGAEMLITTLSGLGYILAVGREFNDMSQIIAVMITIFVIGLLFDRAIFLRLEEKVRSRWGLNQHAE